MIRRTRDEIVLGDGIEEAGKAAQHKNDKIVGVGGYKHDVGAGVDVKQRAAEVEPAGRSQLDIQEGQSDPVHLGVFDRLQRPDKARDRGVRHGLLQHGHALGEDDLVVVHDDDAGAFLALRHELEQRVDVRPEAFGQAGDHRGIGQACGVFPTGDGGVVDKHQFSQLFLSKPLILSQLAQGFRKYVIHRDATPRLISQVSFRCQGLLYNR